MRLDPTRFLAGAAATLMVAGLALQVVSPPLGSTRVAVTDEEDGSVGTPPGAAQTLTDYDAIVRLNPFSPARTPPPTRYQPPGQGRPDAGNPARAPELLALYGIAAGPDGTVALIDADPAVPGAEMYRVGDRVRSARVAAITDSTVVLDGPTGRRVLTLPTAGRRVP